MIQNITFTAKRAYRVMRLLVALLVFAVLDAVLLLFFVDTDGAEKKHAPPRMKHCWCWRRSAWWRVCRLPRG